MSSLITNFAAQEKYFTNILGPTWVSAFLSWQLERFIFVRLWQGLVFMVLLSTWTQPSPGLLMGDQYATAFLHNWLAILEYHHDRNAGRINWNKLLWGCTILEYLACLQYYACFINIPHGAIPFILKPLFCLHLLIVECMFFWNM